MSSEKENSVAHEVACCVMWLCIAICVFALADCSARCEEASQRTKQVEIQTKK